MLAPQRSLRKSRSLLAVVGAVAFGVAGFAMACQSTEDPRAGTPRSDGSSSSSGGASSSSGGIDAPPSLEPIDCGPAPGAEAPFEKRALLKAAAECASWHTCTFHNAALALRASVHAHASAPTDETLEAARAAWKEAMDEWSNLELFQFGPAGSKAVDKYHGRGLRSFVHPWPDLNLCQVQTQIVMGAYKDGITNVLPSARGLHAIEYVLFGAEADLACLPGSPAGQAWSTLGPSDLAVAKNDYAVAVADNVFALANELRSVWLPEGEDFTSKLLAFEGYGNEQETLNVVGWSLFYVEKEIKDWKLASRAGVSPTPPTPETPFAHVDIDNIRTNLRAFRKLFQGCTADGAGVGFDDWLTAAGHQALADEVLAALAQAEEATVAFPPLSQATQDDFAGLYAAIKPLSDLLKTRLFGSASPINLKLPASAASDTD